MKKTLIALATLGAMVGGASAANVTLYGTVDEGLAYKYQKSVAGDGSHETTHSYGMDSGNLFANRFGIKGTEELGNGYSVGFKLESGFDADSGKLAKDNTIFSRESALTLTTPAGSIAAGRMGALTAGTGSYDIFQANADVFDGGVGIIGTGYWHDTGRWSNTLAYTTPDLAGLKLYGQYSFAKDDEGSNERVDDRYWGVGATYDVGALSLVAVVDSVMYKSGTGLSDNYTVSLGGHYNLGMATPFVGVQYGRHMNQFGFINSDSTLFADKFSHADLKGYAATIGSAFDLPTGTLSASVFYSHATGDVVTSVTENQTTSYTNNSLDKADTIGFGLVNAYPLSKRTNIYAGVGYSYTKASWTDTTTKEHNAEAVVGLSHSF